MQHAATRCNTLQHAATRCHTLQHTTIMHSREFARTGFMHCSTPKAVAASETYKASCNTATAIHTTQTYTTTKLDIDVACSPRLKLACSSGLKTQRVRDKARYNATLCDKARYNDLSPCKTFNVCKAVPIENIKANHNTAIYNTQTATQLYTTSKSR